MNFFKSAKYNMGKNSKGKSKDSANEHFQKTNNIPIYSTTTGDTSVKKSAVHTNNDVIACFRISNKTSFVWKMKAEEDTDTIFPFEIPSQENKLVRLGKRDGNSEAIYQMVVSREEETKLHDFKLKLKQDGDSCKLEIDWENLKDLEGIQYKPVTTSQPITLTTEEITVEVEQTG